MEQMELKERFERFFFKTPNDCWLWTGTKNKNGYGVLNNVRKKQQLAHRISYSLYVSEIPDGMLICHKCDVRLCVNPEHLFIGTYKDNIRDMLNKGRGGHWKNDFYGSNNPNAKLTEIEKDLITNKLLKKINTQKELAKIFGVQRQAIGRVCKERGLIKKFRKGWIKSDGLI